MNELEKVNMERSTELMFARREIEKEKQRREAEERQGKEERRELIEYKGKAKRELKILKEHVQKVT